MNISIEVFLGFDEYKEPDIDLNFSGEYQLKAQKYVELILGKDTCFKAGTISTISENMAYEYVKEYYDDRDVPVNNKKVFGLAKGIVGIKRTTGQHPGGVIVVPKGRKIFEFCPVQYLENDVNSNFIITHFDYHSICQNLLRLDILGNDDPTMIKMLQDLTGVNPKEIPLDDKETMSIFNSIDALKIPKGKINFDIGSLGIPEFGSKFMRQILEETRPTTFDELINLSALSHGTNTWLDNAQKLIRDGIIALKDAISCRDDVFIYLKKIGVDEYQAYKIMENVYKGKGLTIEQEVLMKEYDVPDWYIDSCKKIKYMFPKAHATTYVMMAFRIAWFKVHFPLAFYTTYFSVKAEKYKSQIIYLKKNEIDSKIKEIDEVGVNISNKEREIYPFLEVALEMLERGFRFLDIDLK